MVAIYVVSKGRSQSLGLLVKGKPLSNQRRRSGRGKWTLVAIVTVAVGDDVLSDGIHIRHGRLGLTKHCDFVPRLRNRQLSVVNQQIFSASSLSCCCHCLELLCELDVSRGGQLAGGSGEDPNNDLVIGRTRIGNVHQRDGDVCVASHA